MCWGWSTQRRYHNGKWTPPVLFRFDEYVLDTGRRELRRGTETIGVEPQVFDVLELLIRARDRVVSRDELLAEVWHGRIVSRRR